MHNEKMYIIFIVLYEGVGNANPAGLCDVTLIIVPNKRNFTIRRTEKFRFSSFNTML